MKEKNLTGLRIKEARQAKSLKQIELVTTLEDDYGIRMDRSAPARIENRDRGITDYELIAFARLLDVSLEWLFEGKSKLVD